MQKDAGAQLFGKKIAVPFHQQNLSRICMLKFAKSVRHLPNTVLHKNSKFFEQKKSSKKKNTGKNLVKKSRENMLVKLTPRRFK